MAVTSHGHWITGSPHDHDKNISVARCGGINLCGKCSSEAGVWITEERIRILAERERFAKMGEHTPVLSATKYQTKLVEVSAIQFTGEPGNGEDIVKWIIRQGGLAGYLPAEEPYTSTDPNDPPSHYGWSATIHINTIEGIMIAEPGWWIIQGLVGEFYPCRDDAFKAKYELKE